MLSNDIGIANEFENTHRLERRLAAINHNYVAFVTNKAFTEYFGCDHLENLVAYVHPDEQDQFIKFIDSYNGKNDCKGFRLRLADGTYRYNIVKLLFDNDVVIGDHINIEMIDVEGAVTVNQELIDDVTKIRILLGMTDEYTFSYNRSDNIFNLYRYEQFQRTIISSMDIDDWEKYVLSNHYIAPDEESKFKLLINDIKYYHETISVNINTSLRTQTDIMENLRFSGMVFHTANQEGLIIGRILLAEEANKQQSLKIIDELQYDSLTNVFNKKSITEYAKKRLENSKHNRCSIVILDVDHFKSVNDTYGHMYGDKVLARVGAKLKCIVGDEGVVGRIGGDEFLIVLNNTNDDQTLRSMLRAIRTQIKWEFSGDFEDFMVTCSIGASIYPNNGSTFDELFNKADYCLYIAKEKGRDRYVYFRDELHRKSFEKTFANKLQGPQSNREIKELQFVREFMLQSVAVPEKALQLARDHMMTNYKVDSIRIYKGSDFKRIYAYGQVQEHTEEAQYVESEEFQKLLDGKTYIEVGFFSKLEANAPQFCRIMRERRTLSTIQCLIGTKDHVVGLIVFDKYKEASQWADYEVNCAVIVSAMLSRLALEKEK